MVHHLRPEMTYSSPSRRMDVSMLPASDDATPGSVMLKAERISPFSSGSSHRSRCSAVANMSSSSMFPVSGAAQFIASGAMWGLRPLISAKRRVLHVGQAGPGRRVRQEEVPEPSSSGFCLQRAHGGRSLPAEVAARSLRLELRLDRVDVLVHEVGQVAAQSLGLGHRRKSPCLCSRLRQVSIVSRPRSASGPTMAPICSNPSPTVWPLTNR